MGPIYSTESVKTKRFLSSWVPRDSVERKEAGEKIQIMRGLPITAGLARDYESENTGGLEAENDALLTSSK